MTHRKGSLSPARTRMAWPRKSILAFARGGTSPAAALTQFAVAGVIAVALLALAGVTVLRNSGTPAASREAKRVTRSCARGIVEWQSGAAPLHGARRAIAHVDQVVRRG